MAKKPKEDRMKDNLHSGDLTDFTDPDFFGMGMDAEAMVPGTRHSIRARSKSKVKPSKAKPSSARKTAPVQAELVATPKRLLRPTRPERAATDHLETLPLVDMMPDHPVIPRPQTTPETPALMTGWQDLHKVDAGSRKGAGRGIPVVDLERDNPSHRAFDLLRTRLRQTTQENKWVNIGVSAPTSGCGTTFTAVNLALSLSRVVESRTVLMDFNLRDPKVMEAFDMAAPGDMQDYLSGTVDMQEHMMRISDTLALGLNATADRNAAETLQSSRTQKTLEAMRASLTPELVIYDLPPMLVSDDVSAFMPQLDGMLLVSDGTQTVASQLLECERMLDGQVPLLGVVLNRARASSIPRYS
jgi:Mrp family chromosome partitioning ATPase